jgi:tRNA threonylcarbamoyladenosine biosynthesis protein TsaB
VALALDAAGLACSAAVIVSDRVVGAERVSSMRAQAEALLPMADRVIRAGGLSPADLNLVVATVGPGSFTGIRVGLAAARGIALAAGARLIGVTSFAAAAASLERNCDSDRFVVVALESRRADIYIQLFDAGCNPIGEPAAMMPAALGGAMMDTIGESPLLIAGDAAQRAGLALSERQDTTVLENSPPDAVGAWRAARGLLRRGEKGDTRPLYLRPPDVTSTRGEKSSALVRA